MQKPFRIGEWRVDPQQDQIINPDKQVKIEPRAMQLLVYLAERAGQMITREEILEAVWAEKFITDEVLTNAVGKLRKALGDDPKGPHYIQTIPNRAIDSLLTSRT